MVEIVLAKSFRKKFSDRIPWHSKLHHRVAERVKLFSINPATPVLADHPLQGEMKEYRAFSITKDVRIIYRIIGHMIVEFIDIGTHNQVYRK